MNEITDNPIRWKKIFIMYFSSECKINSLPVVLSKIVDCSRSAQYCFPDVHSDFPRSPVQLPMTNSMGESSTPGNLIFKKAILNIATTNWSSAGWTIYRSDYARAVPPVADYA